MYVFTSVCSPIGRGRTVNKSSQRCQIFQHDVVVFELINYFMYKLQTNGLGLLSHRADAVEAFFLLCL